MIRNVSHHPLAMRLALSLQHLLAVFAGTVFVPIVLGNGEYIDDMSARECEELDSQVIFCSDGSISIEVLA